VVSGNGERSVCPDLTGDMAALMPAMELTAVTPPGAGAWVGAEAIGFVSAGGSRGCLEAGGQCPDTVMGGTRHHSQVDPGPVCRGPGMPHGV
jgi:hypothetical protein